MIAVEINYLLPLERCTLFYIILNLISWFITIRVGWGFSCVAKASCSKRGPAVWAKMPLAALKFMGFFKLFCFFKYCSNTI